MTAVHLSHSSHVQTVVSEREKEVHARWDGASHLGHTLESPRRFKKPDAWVHPLSWMQLAWGVAWLRRGSQGSPGDSMYSKDQEHPGWGRGQQITPRGPTLAYLHLRGKFYWNTAVFFH